MASHRFSCDTCLYDEFCLCAGLCVKVEGGAQIIYMGLRFGLYVSCCRRIHEITMYLESDSPYFEFMQIGKVIVEA